MGTLGQFADEMKTVAGAIEKNTSILVRKVALAALTTVVMATPVGNPTLWKHPRKGYVGGRARANWLVGLGAPVSGAVDTVDPSGGGVLSAGSSAIGGAAPGMAIHITNNLDYIEALNDGHSHQAPSAFVEAAVAAAIAAVNGADLTREGGVV